MRFQPTNLRLNFRVLQRNIPAKFCGRAAENVHLCRQPIENPTNHIFISVVRVYIRMAARSIAAIATGYVAALQDVEYCAEKSLGSGLSDSPEVSCHPVIF